MPSSRPEPDLRPARLVALVAAGGALGSLARAGSSAALEPALGLAGATVAVNLLGCLLLGLLLGRAPGPGWRAFAGTGLLAGFTTTSLLAVEAVRATPGAGAAQVAVSVGGGLLLVAAGRAQGRRA